MIRLLHSAWQHNFVFRILAVMAFIAFGIALLVLVAFYRTSVDCYSGNALTQLFHNVGVERAELRDMKAALAAFRHLRDLSVESVAGHRIILRDPNGVESARFSSSGPQRDDPGELLATWRAVYLKSHPNASKAVITTVMVDFGGERGIPISPAACISI